MFDKPQPLQVERLDSELHEIRKTTFNSMLVLEDYVRAAEAFLGQDIPDPDLEEAAKDDPQIFFWRANQIGVALAEREAYRHSVRVYGALLRQAEDFVKNTGKQRDLRALKANFGMVMVLNRDFDAGVNLILESAPEIDVAIYRRNPRDAYALNFLRGGVEKDAATHYINLCGAQFRTATGQELVPDAVLTMANHLNPLGEVTLVSLIPLMQHVEWQKRAPTPFGRVRIMDGLRWLSSMLENMARSIGSTSLKADVKRKFTGNPGITLWPAYQNLFEGQLWWAVAARVVGGVGAKILNTDSDANIVAKYQALFAMPENSREDIFTKTVVLSPLTRNLSMHFLELPTLVIDQIVGQIIQYQMLAQLLVFDWGLREGHFTQLNDPGVWPR